MKARVCRICFCGQGALQLLVRCCLHQVQFSKEMGGEEPAPRGTGGEAMVRKLQRTRQTIDEKLNNTPFKLFEGGAEISGDFRLSVLPDKCVVTSFLFFSISFDCCD